MSKFGIKGLKVKKFKMVQDRSEL